MQLESFGYNTEDLMFFWQKPDNEAIDMGVGLELPQFRILGFRTENCTKTYTSGSYTCIKGNSTRLYQTELISAEFILKREIGYYSLGLFYIK